MVFALLLVAAAGFALYQIGGPRNLIGMLRYDQREEGTLKVGDRAPDLTLVGLDGSTRTALLAPADPRPTVLIFGSFT